MDRFCGRGLAVGMLLWTVLALTFPARAAVTFPDATLEAKIREKIGKPTGPIEATDLAGLTRFNLYNTDVRDLTGLEHCVNVTHVFFFQNKIERIDCLAKMPQLDHVVISRNPITDLSPLAALPKLANLGIQEVPAEDFSPLAGCASLRYLDISGTKPRDLSPISALTGLEQIDLTAMGLTDIGFVSTLTKLRSLKADRNEIEDLAPLCGLHDLEHLDLRDNRVSDLRPLADIYAVERIYLRNNRIEDLAGFPTLAKDGIVQLAGNRITDLQPLVAACRDASGTRIELGENRLGFEAFRRDIHELEARGNEVFFTLAQKQEESTRFPDIYVVAGAAGHPEAELILAMVNRGTTDEELGRRFGLGGDASGPDTVMAEAATPVVENAATPDTQAVATPADPASTSDTAEVLNVTLSTTGMKIENHIGEIVLLGLVALLVIVWKIPRRA